LLKVVANVAISMPAEHFERIFRGFLEVPFTHFLKAERFPSTTTVLKMPYDLLQSDVRTGFSAIQHPVPKHQRFFIRCSPQHRQTVWMPKNI